jgi:hypothetical protein
VPLSEDEQRILFQIEQEFYESDPQFAAQVGQTSLYRHATRNIKWSIVGFIAGVVVLLAALRVHFLLAFVGFLVIFASAVVLEQNARKLGRAGLQQLGASMKGKGLGGAIGGAGRRFKRRGKPD